MLKKLDRFSEALQTRNPDQHIVAFFNDVYDAAEGQQRYIDELETTQLHLMLHHQEFVKFISNCIRIKMGAFRTLKQLRSCRN